jgi:hypothetical protein
MLQCKLFALCNIELTKWSKCRIYDPQISGYEKYYLLGYITVYSVESQQTFRRNISPPFLESNKPSNIPA